MLSKAKRFVPFEMRLYAHLLLAPDALFLAGSHPSTLTRMNFATSQVAAFWLVFERVLGG